MVPPYTEDDTALTASLIFEHMEPEPTSLPAYLDLGNGRAYIRCRDAYQALNLATLFVAMTIGKRALIIISTSSPADPPPATT